MSVSEQRQNMIGLPLQERTVAVALKHIFDQIKKIQQEQSRQLEALSHSYIQQFKHIQNKASQIIRGTTNLNQYLAKNIYLFTEDEKSELDAISSSNKPISQYWLTALTNFYGQDLSQADQQIAAALKDISTNITKDTMDITFDIGPNEWIQAEILTKQFILQQGEVIGVTQGGNANWLKPRPDGIFAIIFREQQLYDLNDAFTIANQLVNEVVPYSLRYYLDATEQVDQQPLAEQNDQDEQQDGSVPLKKIKQ